ncbi:MAG: ADOP family duplicated permease, partial [Actinomycetota bacterium]
MSLRARLQSLLGKRSDVDLQDEMAFHLETEIRKNVQAGIPGDEARRQALIAFGGVQQTRERVSETRWTHFAEVLVQDARYAWRLLRKTPLFTMTVVITLAAGIGLNTAIFSMIDAVLFRPLPASHPQELVLLRWHAQNRPKLHSQSTYGDCPQNSPSSNDCSFSLPWLNTMRSQSSLFSGVAGWAGAPEIDLSGNGPATIVNNAGLVSGDFFPTLGVRSALGRTLQPDDDSEKAAPVLVLSYEYWKSAFGGSTDVVGRTVRLNGLPCTIVGVAERGFQDLAPGRHSDFWLPLSIRARLIPRFTPDENDAGSWWVVIVARLRDGISRKQAEAAVNLLFINEMEHGQKPLFKAGDRPGMDLIPAQQGLTGGRGDTLQPLYILMMAVGLVLLIACANIGGLLLARATRRTREVAVRLTLGARRGRILSQVLMESALLAVIGGLLGLLLAQWTGRLLLLLPQTEDSGPPPFMPHLDVRILLFAFIVSLLTALMVGVVPALRTLRVDLTPALKVGNGSSDGGGPGRWYSPGNVLVVAQVALAIVALISAGLMVRTLRNLKNTQLGFDPRNLLVFEIDPTLAGYKPNQVDGLYRELRGKFAALPGVTSVSYSWFPLLGHSYSRTDFHLPGTPENEKPLAGYLPVGPGFFASMGVPLLSGRDFSSADFAVAAAAADLPPGVDQDSKSPPMPAIVNEMFARKFFANVDPVGRHLEDSLPENPRKPRGPGYRIVGVVGNAKYQNLRRQIGPTLYVPSAGQDVSFAVRSAADPSKLVPAIREIVNLR